MRSTQLLSALLLPLSLATTVAAQTRPYDIVFRGGTVVDRSGAAGYRADVAVKGDRIRTHRARGDSRQQAALALDARGLVVAPGFIATRMHTSRTWPRIRWPRVSFARASRR